MDAGFPRLSRRVFSLTWAKSQVLEGANIALDMGSEGMNDRRAPSTDRSLGFPPISWAFWASDGTCPNQFHVLHVWTIVAFFIALEDDMLRGAWVGGSFLVGLQARF